MNIFFDIFAIFEVFEIFEIFVIFENLYNKAQFMCVCLRVHFCPGHIYEPILKPRVPMDSPWPRDDYKNIKFLKI